MNWKSAAISIVAFALFSIRAPAADESPDYAIRAVPAHKVQFTDAFWQPRLETTRDVTIPLSFQLCEETGRIENFKVAAGLSDKKWVGKFGFNDSDVSKVMEGAAYSLMTHPDPKLAAYLEAVVGYMAAAQEKDGYLETIWTARDKMAEPDKMICCWPKKTKWLGEVDSHELYNLGHMYEAAAAHYQATGEASFLNVAKKSADLLLATFGPGKTEVPPGHPEVELGLIKLYRATGDRRYVDLAKFFIDIRGVPTKDRPKLWGPYNQDHKPFREQDEAVGHAVRAAYLYSAAADVAALTGDESLVKTLDNLWASAVSKKQYITGGIGSTANGEAFGKNFDLPNDTAYCETCAGIAFCYWAERMFLLHGDAQYIDALERTLYNNVLDGVSLDGKTFFYPNPLASHGDHERSKWFDCSCCPTNLCRFMPSAPGYAYAVRDDAIYVNLFVEGEAAVELKDGKVQIAQKTRYPWDGRVEISVKPQTPGQKFALHVRIPGWTQSGSFSGDLYRYLTDAADQPAISVNGERTDVQFVKGYAVIDRAWKAGDKVILELPMQVGRVVASDEVEADRGRVAIMRGPIVYCVEWPDVEGKVLDLVLPDDAKLATEYSGDTLGGVQLVTGTATRTAEGATTSVPFKAIPYYAWANRGKGEMEVWLPRTQDALH